jgi:hypothetical protein
MILKKIKITSYLIILFLFSFAVLAVAGPIADCPSNEELAITLRVGYNDDQHPGFLARVDNDEFGSYFSVNA